ncbi:MAG: hypothetical protein J6W56_12375 [Prevotella sp.]|nr:hypothetical protein [Prevotella sp.]
MKKIICLAIVASLAFVKVQAQNPSNLTLLNEKEKTEYIPVFQYWKEHNILQHLDLSLTAGTTGIGLDVASQVGDYVQVRAGYEFVPRFHKNLKFNLTVGGEPARKYDKDGNRVITKFDKMNEFLYQFTGYDVEDHVDMIGTPTINNFKFMVDVTPLKDYKNWHVTAGFFWGPSQFAYAENSTEAMVSLLSVGMYNRMYEKATSDPVEPLIDLEELGYSGIQFDKEVQDMIYQKIRSFGRLGFAMGTFKHDVVDNKGVVHYAGEPYIMEPDDDCMVRVKAKSNAFKPYLGVGYSGRLVKGRDDWKISVDAGAMFWGGTPDLIVHDGINLTKDVENIGGQVGDYVDLFKAFKVYPVLTVRFTKNIF